MEKASGGVYDSYQFKRSTLQIFQIEKTIPLNTKDNILQRNLKNYISKPYKIPKQTDYQKIGSSGNGCNIKDC